ncbi:MFS transporter [Skeletonema marinoi]|uniref:MFS transporter n=2 Tax=Skeletonema marinoi TaxID=267567 RepID=A0AAD8XV63_9STRA|nr:MFS transporter [Skeletonema marinoi]
MFHRSSSTSNGDDGHASDGGGPLSLTTQDPTTSQNQENEEKPQPHPTGHESLLRFLLLPNQVLIVLALEFLNSFRSFGLRFVLYNYVTNEFGISDVKAGALLGTKGFIDILFGTIGSIMVDMIGVRRISIIAMSVAIIGRTLLAFGRSTTSLYLALFLFSPCGDALLSVGLYRVALKKLTTPLTRPLAFAMSYAVSNLAGALADVCVDKMRSSLKDVQIDDENGGGGGYLSGVFTPIRQFIVVTWVIVLVTFGIAYCFLEDWTVIDPNDLDDDEKRKQSTTTRHQTSSVENETDDDDHDATTTSIILPADALPASPMIRPHLLQRWFPTHYDSVQAIEDEHHQLEVSNDDNNFSTSTMIRRRSFPKYQMYRTRYNHDTQANSPNEENSSTSRCSGLIKVINQVIAILKLRNTWRVLIFGFLSFTIVLDWTASEIVLPPFLERRFGEKIPIYTIQSINLFGCLILPPFVGALTTGREDFQIVMPGLWLMAISPIFVALSPNVGGACIWQIVMTIGEVLWSPRIISWTASLAPTGMEGLFFAITSARAILGPITDAVMGTMNDKYNTNCPECRDQYGHFCDVVVNNNDNANNAVQCVSAQEECNLFLDNQQQQSCPQTCLECPTWVPTDPSTFWYLLMIAGIAAPLSVWLFLPFLRGAHVRDDRCYGLFRVNKARIFGICGAPDDADQESNINIRRRQGRQVYGHLDSNSSSSNSTSSVMANGVDIELT